MGRPKGSTSIPTYRLHKSSGQAIVTIKGTDFYLGAHGSAPSKQKYHRLIAESLSRGGCVATDDETLTIAELAAAYLSYAQDYYRNLHPSSFDRIRYAVALLKKLYADTPARGFDQVKFEAMRGEMIRTPNPWKPSRLLGSRPASRSH